MALQILEEIAAVDGVAAGFLGPSDLSADLGHLGKPEAPEVRQTILEAAARLRVIGKPWGILVGSADSAHFYPAHGASFVAADSALGLFLASGDDLELGSAACRERVCKYGIDWVVAVD